MIRAESPPLSSFKFLMLTLRVNVRKVEDCPNNCCLNKKKKINVSNFVYTHELVSRAMYVQSQL